MGRFLDVFYVLQTFPGNLSLALYEPIESVQLFWKYASSAEWRTSWADTKWRPSPDMKEPRSKLL